MKCGGGNLIISGKEQWNNRSNTLEITPGVVNAIVTVAKLLLLILVIIFGKGKRIYNKRRCWQRL
ncbi:hypothetical protein V6B95_10895 [Thermoanaerobacterium saccharolyticum]